MKRGAIPIRIIRTAAVIILFLASALTAACDDELMQQSPVNITGSISGDAPSLAFGYNTRGADHITNDGDFVKVKFDNAGSILIDAQGPYDLTELHVHNPSEHTIEDERFALESHMVYRKESGELAVVGILYRLGEPNDAIQQIIDSAPRQGESDTKPSSLLKFSAFLPDGHGYYEYSGSLTTPPYTEGVHWFVMSDILEVSNEQVGGMAALTGGGTNNREVQPLNGREIREFQPTR